MENKSISIKKHILKYGVLFGLSGIILSLTIYLTGDYVQKKILHSTILFFVTVIAIMIGLIVFKNSNGGYISLGQALKIGIGLAVLGSFIAILWKIVLIRVIDPEIITQIEDTQIKRLAEKTTEYTQKDIERKIAVTQKATSPIAMIMYTLGEHLLLGFLISLIGGLIIRKKRDPFK